MAQKIDIPLFCPTCDGRMYAVSYDPPLKILKDRSWFVCKSCDYDILAEDFKKTLFTI